MKVKKEKWKEFVWEIEGFSGSVRVRYSGSVQARNYDEAREIINELISIQEVEE